MKEKAIELMNAVYSEDELQKKKIEETREAFATVAQFILENMKDSREKSLTLTKLEEGCMWAIKGITREKNYKQNSGNSTENLIHNTIVDAISDAKIEIKQPNQEELVKSMCEAINNSISSGMSSFIK